MKKFLTTTIIATSLFATDYSTMTLDELKNLRGTISDTDKIAYRSAIQSKMSTLTPEERNTYKTSNTTQNKQRLRDGSGSGGMYKGSKGHGGGR
jgi:hypothetical protein